MGFSILSSHDFGNVISCLSGGLVDAHLLLLLLYLLLDQTSFGQIRHYSLRRNWVFSRVHCVVLGLSYCEHLNIWGDSLPHIVSIVVDSLLTHAAHLTGFLVLVLHSCAHQVFNLLLTHSVLLMVGSCVHRRVLLFHHLARCLLLNNLPLMELIAYLDTRLIDRLAARTTCIFHWLCGLLLLGDIGLLLESLLLLLLVIGQDWGVFDRRGHLAAMFLADKHLWSLVRVLRVSKTTQLLRLIAHFWGLPTRHYHELALVAHLIGKHLIWLRCFHTFLLKGLHFALFGALRMLNNLFLRIL